MKIFSDHLTTYDLHQAARKAGVELFHAERIYRERPRLRTYLYEISLSGSSPYTSQSSFCEPHKAATWSEWGRFMVELYKIDREARIGHYKSVDDFIDQTRRISEHPGNNRPDNKGRYAAPWLKDAEFMEW